MKGTLWGLILILSFSLLSACATSKETAQMKAFYDKYEKHCREHAREIVAEVDEQESYEECMAYFIGTDPECPLEGDDFRPKKLE